MHSRSTRPHTLGSSPAPFLSDVGIDFRDAFRLHCRDGAGSISIRFWHRFHIDFGIDFGADFRIDLGIDFRIDFGIDFRTSLGTIYGYIVGLIFRSTIN